MIEVRTVVFITFRYSELDIQHSTAANESIQSLKNKIIHFCIIGFTLSKFNWSLTLMSCWKWTLIIHQWKPNLAYLVVAFWIYLD